MVPKLERSSLVVINNASNKGTECFMDQRQQRRILKKNMQYSLDKM